MKGRPIDAVPSRPFIAIRISFMAEPSKPDVAEMTKKIAKIHHQRYSDWW
jgi:hypothetical protein